MSETAMKMKYAIGVNDARYRIAKLSDGKYMAYKRVGNVDRLICVRCDWQRAWGELHSAAALDVSRNVAAPQGQDSQSAGFIKSN